jgi:g-D-glutamyl-meso-diaminopimelate peptidase
MFQLSVKEKILLGIILVIVLAVAGFTIWSKKKVVTPTPIIKTENPTVKISTIGKSVEGRDIQAYTYGSGATHIAFVGGIHGGYEWNSVALAYNFIDYLKNNPGTIPSNLTITVIPSANPDGVYKVTGKYGFFTTNDVPTKNSAVAGLGRFNSDNVDLNRNFDCNWKATSTWREKIVSAGTFPFSEPETKAIRNYISNDKPVAVIFWHSQSNAVYASECNKGILPDTLNIMNVYSLATGYPAVKTFDSYKVTGDAEGWLASINIPAITVELKTHETIEWEKNLAGIKGILEYYKNK